MKTTMHLQISATVIAWSLVFNFFSGKTWAEEPPSLQIVTDTTASNPITPTIAVVPFNNADGARDIAAVIEADLISRGRFRALPRGEQPGRPVAPTQVTVPQWQAVKADYLIVGSVTALSENLGVEFYLMDIASGEQMLGFHMPPAPRDSLRYVGHQIADIINERITGRPGDFNTKIAYVEAQGSGSARMYRLYIADIDGYAPRMVASTREALMSPAWSPDRRQLTFVGYERGKPAIYVLTIATGVLRKVAAFAGLNGSPAWSPDGRQLAIMSSFDGDVEIATVDLASGERHRLTQSPGIDTEPTWSPDGRQIAFTSDRGGRPGIYLMNADGSNPRAIASEAKQGLDAAFSPNGRTLAYVFNDGSGFRIATFDLESGATKPISEGPRDSSPSFSPAGEAILFLSSDAAYGTLMIVSTDGRVRSKLQKLGDVHEPVWSPLVGGSK